MFESLKKAWAASQQQLNRQQFEKCVVLLFGVADEASRVSDPRGLYVSARAAKLRAEVIFLRKRAGVDILQIEQFITGHPAWAGALTEPERAAVETVITHLKHDLQCNPPH